MPGDGVLMSFVLPAADCYVATAVVGVVTLEGKPQQEEQEEQEYTVVAIADEMAAGCSARVYVVDHDRMPAVQPRQIRATVVGVEEGAMKAVVVLRLAVDATVLDAVRDADVRKALVDSHTTPLAARSLWAYGRAKLFTNASGAAAGHEENEGGDGWLYQWRTTGRTAKGFAGMQEWGYFLSHPVRVVAFHPSERTVVVPLLECATRAEAVEFMAWMSEVELSPAFDPVVAYRFFLGRPPPVFGRALPLDGSVPTVVDEICSHLASRVTSLVGVFRVSGNSVDVAALRKAYDDRVRLDLTRVDSHAVASLLKVFLRDLPTPLLSWAFL
jgi:hypothetical protein